MDQDQKVYVFSMEMGRDQFWSRLLSRLAGVDATRMAKGTLNKRELRKLVKAKKDLEKVKGNLFLDDTTYDATDLINKAAELIAEHGPGVVIIDYLQMAQSEPGESMYEKVSRVSRQYKLVGKGMQVPVFTLAQMNREGEDLTEDSETHDSVLEGSGKIEQYADVVLMLLGLRRPGIVRRTIVQHKDRHRESGHRIRLSFNQSIMRFEEEGFWTNITRGPAPQTMKAKDFFN